MKTKNSIIAVLKKTFILWFVIVMIISATSLFAWYRQQQQVYYITQDYLPEANIILKVEDDVNAFFNELEHFSNIKNNVNRQAMFKSLKQRIVDIEKVLQYLPDLKRKTGFLAHIKKLYKLIEDINQNVSNGILIEQNKQNILTKIQWLNDDFNSEVISLNQELSLQQINIVKQNIENTQSLLDEVQVEIQSIYQLELIKEQMKLELVQFVSELNERIEPSYYENLKNNINTLYLSYQNKENKASIIPLQQMVFALNSMLANDGELTQLVKENSHYQNRLIEINLYKKNIIDDTKLIADELILNSKEQLIQLNNQLKLQTKISGVIILISFVILLLLVLGFYYLYIKGSIKKRFELLIYLVKKLNQGKTDLAIDIIGNDEITEMALLLKKHTEIIQERKLMEKDLQETQNELIQAAKLAVVGQTMTTLAHEINQPLNAISVYLFNCKRLISKQDYFNATQTLDKISLSLERITRIIKRLRQFAKKNEQDNLLQQIDLESVILDAWNFLELQHQTRQAELNISANTYVLADKVLLEQIFVNLFSNSLDACQGKPIIDIYLQQDKYKTSVFISDNGSGWVNTMPDKLLQPFYTNKEVGLGLGLTICQRIMQQFNGRLFIASNLNKGAVINLEFPHK